MPINSTLNSASVNLTWVFKKSRNGTKKTSQIWKSRLKWFVIYSCKTGKYLKQIFLTESWPGILWIKLCLSNFDSFSLACDPILFPGKNISNIAKSNHIFPGKGREDEGFILTFLDSSMAKVFPHYLFFSISAILRRKRGVKVGPKVLILGLFHKYSNPSKFFKQIFCLLEQAWNDPSLPCSYTLRKRWNKFSFPPADIGGNDT